LLSRGGVKFFIYLLSVICFFSHAQADVTFKCDQNHHISSFNSEAQPAVVSDSATSASGASKIQITYPFVGPNSQVASDSYSRDALSKMVELAVQNDVDPYLAVAVLLMENPPTSSNKSKNYTTLYGQLPIDETAVYKELQCYVPIANPEAKTVAGTYYSICKGDKDCTGVIKKSGQGPDYLHPHSTNAHELCSGICSTSASGGSAGFYDLTKQVYQEGRWTDDDYLNPADKCCCIKSDFSVDDSRNLIAINYLKSNVQIHIKGDKNLSYSLQRYNGLGCFGCKGENEVKNACFNGLNMGERPVYGARIADIMLNMLMPNKRISDLVINAESKFQKKSVNSFCLESGEGAQTLDNRKFWDQQHSFLMDGAQAHYRSYSSNGADVDAEKDRDKYQEIEKTRANICSKYFTPTKKQKPAEKPTKSSATQ